MVDDNANTSGLLAANASLLKLSQGEPSPLANLPVVADSLCTDSGAEEGEGADTKGRSLGLAGLAATELAAGLVEPGADAALPVLTEMVLVENCIAIQPVSTVSACAKCRNRPLLCLKPIA